MARCPRMNVLNSETDFIGRQIINLIYCVSCASSIPYPGEEGGKCNRLEMTIRNSKSPIASSSSNTYSPTHSNSAPRAHTAHTYRAHHFNTINSIQFGSIRDIIIGNPLAHTSHTQTEHVKFYWKKICWNFNGSINMLDTYQSV